MKKSIGHELFLPRKQIWLGKDGMQNIYAATPGHHSITSDALKQHLENGSYTMMSAANPKGEDKKLLSDEENSKRMGQLEAELKSHGAIWHRTTGHYGYPEPSMMVHHMGSITPQLLEQIAKKYGQESVLHSTNNTHQLKFVNGEHQGKHHKGTGHVFSDKLTDFFTDVPKASKFQNELDFSTLHKSHAKHYTVQTRDGKTIHVKHHTDWSALHD